MIRTIISLDPESKQWLDRTARRRRVPMSRLVREAVEVYRTKEEAKAPSLRELLDATRGTWKGGEPLAYVRRIRSEWDRKP